MNHRILQCVGLVFTCAVCPPVFAGPVTFDFTGTVKDSTGPYAGIPHGTEITGTYTIDLAAANPAQGAGTVASGTWFVSNSNGTDEGIPASSSFVFTSTASVDGFHYSTAPSSPFFNDSFVQIETGSQYNGEEIVQQSSTSPATVSSFGIYNSHGPYTSAGLPNFIPGTVGAGSFMAGGGDVDYTITSMTVSGGTTSAVPEPGTVPLMLVGLTLLGLTLLRRTRTQL